MCHGYGSTGNASGTLEKGNKTDARAIESATGFKGVNATNN